MFRKFLSILFSISVLSAIALVLNAHRTFAADQVVSDCGDNGGANQLRAKLAAVQSSGGGTLTFTCGPNTIVLLGGVLPPITTNTTIDGGGNIELSGGDVSRIFLVNTGATLTLNDISLSHGHSASDDGGAIHNQGTLNVNRCTFSSNNTEGSGGAIYAASNSTLTVTDSVFSANQAGSGGALSSAFSALTTIQTTILSTNHASTFGGAFFFDGPATLTDLTISGNSAEGGGGGIHVSSGSESVRLTNSTVSENTSESGGGISILSGVLVATNVTISRNSASAGGGIYGSSTLTNVTLSGNSATEGSGVYIPFFPLTLKNTILANSGSGGNCFIAPGATAPSSQGCNLSSDNTCAAFLNQTGDVNNTNPLLGPLADNGGFTLTHLPQAGSPALDNGTSTGAPTADQRGILRPQGTGFDIGSVEAEIATPTPSETATPTI